MLALISLSRKRPVSSPSQAYRNHSVARTCAQICYTCPDLPLPVRFLFLLSFSFHSLFIFIFISSHLRFVPYSVLASLIPNRNVRLPPTARVENQTEKGSRHLDLALYPAFPECLRLFAYFFVA